MSRPEYVASLDTDKRRGVASENLTRWRISPEGQAKLSEYLHSDRNPFRDPAVRAKAQAALREKGYSMLNGGNGRDLTVPQKLLAARLGWATEVVVPTGRKSPYPHAYKIDVASPELMIAVEVDGESHKSKTAKTRDSRKDNLLRSLGWTVLRFWNAEVLDETDRVVRQIMEAVGSTTSRQGRETTS
jgi:hypothetical protein